LIKVDLTKCTGCRRCETACAFFHTGKINHHLSRIKVLNLYEIGIDGPVVCVQCQERYCMRCPADALSMGNFGQVVASPTVCTLCGSCEKSCPIGAIEIFDENENRPLLFDIKKETKKMNPSQKRQFYVNRLGMEVRKRWRKKIA